MATVVPPPSKRQKLADADKAARDAEALTIPEDQGTVRIQFIDSSSGKATGPPVAIAVKDATVKNLENLLNTLQSASADHDEPPDRVPYRFYFTPDNLPKTKNEEDQRPASIDILHSIYHSILSTGYLSTETTIPLHYTPQSVFRVRPVTRCSASIPGHASPILSCTFAPGPHASATLATGSGDNTARIWDTATGTPKHTLKGHAGWVLALSFSPGDGKILATGSMDNTVRLWDSSTGQALGGSMKGHTKWITSLAWEPVHAVQQGKPRVASSSKDSTVRIWDAALRRVEQVLSGHKASVTCVRWGGVGRVYTASQDKTIKVWNTRGWNCLWTLTSHAHWVNHLALSTDAVLKGGWWDPDPRARGDVPTETEGRKKRAKERFETAARVDGVVTERLVSASDDNTLFLWEPSKFDANSNATPKPVARMLGHQKQVNQVAFSPDGAWVASASFDNSVKLWDARDGKFVTTLRGHVGAVYMCAFSADSRLLVSCSKDTTVKVWDVKTGKLKEDLPGHKDEVYAVDWSGDGGAVGSGGADKIVKVWKN